MPSDEELCVQDLKDVEHEVKKGNAEAALKRKQHRPKEEKPKVRTTPKSQASSSADVYVEPAPAKPKVRTLANYEMSKFGERCELKRERACLNWSALTYRKLTVPLEKDGKVTMKLWKVWSAAKLKARKRVTAHLNWGTLYSKLTDLYKYRWPKAVQTNRWQRAQRAKGKSSL